MKKILLSLSLLLAILITSCTQQLQWIPFNWEGAQLGDKYFDKSAIFIPVSIDGIPHEFSMQLDLGAVRTNFYGKSLNAYLEAYPDFKQKIDSTKAFYIEGEKCVMFGDVNLNLGSVALNGVDIGYFKGFGEEIPKDSINTASKKHIGTIASDIFEGKILIIDYKNSRMAVADELSEEYKNITYQKYGHVSYGPISIPLQLDGKEQYLMFDTGSSLFSLITSEKNALTIASPEIVETLTVSSWGEDVTAYGLQTNKPIHFGEKELNSSIVYYMDDMEDFFESVGIWGITGNAYFLDNIVVIDYKNGLFGIK